MSDVFISYSSKDRAAVEPIVRQLQEHGVDVFWDVLIEPGESFQDRLQQHLTAAKAVLVIWSQHAANSEWVRSEALFAADQNKYIPISLGDTFSIPVPFEKYQTMRWSSPGGTELVGPLLARFAKLGVKSSATKPPAPPRLPTSEPQTRGFAFISHVEEDVPVVSTISQFLKKREYSYWTYHESDRDYQKPTVLEIEERMLESVLMLTVISPEWKRSEWTQRELAFAREIRKPLFHLRFRNPGPTLAIAGDTYFDFERGEQDAFTKLGAELDKKRL